MVIANETVKSGPLVEVKFVRKKENFDSWSNKLGQEVKLGQTKPKSNRNKFPSYSLYFKFSFHFSFFSNFKKIAGFQILSCCCSTNGAPTSPKHSSRR
jgi:hypothetical protein